MAWNNFLAYVYFNTIFGIHTDARDLQLVEVIIQEYTSIALYSRKPTGFQTRYAVMEKGILSIIENMKEICAVLIDQGLNIYTKHNNIICKKSYRKDINIETNT